MAHNIGHTEFVASQVAHLLGKKSYWEAFWDNFNAQKGADWDIDL